MSIMEKRHTAREMFLMIFKIIGAGITAVILLSVFVLVYAYSGANVSNPSGATDYILGYRFRSNCKEGISWNFIDESGFNNAFKSEQKDPEVLLMGSSNMAALNVMPDKSTAYRLNEKLSLDDMYLYNIGMDGHTISRCINNLNAAVENYDSAEYVILETGSVYLDRGEMKAVIDGTLERLSTYESKIMRMLQKIPCAKILYKRIQGSFDELKPTEETTVQSSETDKFDARLTGALLKKAAEDNGGRKMIIMYHPTLKLGYDGSIETEEKREDIESFAKLCRDNNIEFADMTDKFINMYETEHKLPHGFCNTQVGFGHLNADGHNMIAEELYTKIKDLEKEGL